MKQVMKPDHDLFVFGPYELDVRTPCVKIMTFSAGAWWVNKTGVNYDPFCLTHSHANSDHYFHLKFVLFREILNGQHM